ncbi:hypothetical protein AAG906_003115 [Vitis piasezkii]
MCSYLLDLKHLQYLDLSCNYFGSLNIPEFFGSLSTLRYLNLSSADSLNAKDIEWISGLTFLKFLDVTNVNLSKASNWLQVMNKPGKGLELLRLRGNKLLGHLPSELGQLKSLSYLSIDGNLFSGQIPISLGRIPSSSYLNIRENFFNGIIQLRMDSSFQLTRLELGSCFLGPQFPAWLQTQKYLRDLNMSYAGISSVIPAWFWTQSYLIVDLSHNQIIGNIPSLHSFHIYLGSNNFTGPLPRISSDVAKLDLSNNLFCGSLTHNFPIVGCIGELTRLKLGNNNLTGHIPSSMGSLIWLGSLHLRNNHLSGNFPLPLKNCSSLVVVDLGENEFTGTIPAWMGNFDGKFIETLPGDGEIRYTPGLMVLVLHSNNNAGYERSRVRVRQHSWPPSWHRPLKQ